MRAVRKSLDLLGWRGLMFVCTLLLAIGGAAFHSEASITLKKFTANTQDDGSILLEWVTELEIDTSSFRIHRALTATGPWNEDTVVHTQYSHSDGEHDAVYEYIDTDVAVGTTYYYMLEEEEVEIETTGGVNRYVDFIRSATAGQPGAPPSTPTATPTITPTATPGASPTPSRTPSPTATRTTAAAATDVPTAAPTATRQSANTPPPQGQPQPTPSLTVPSSAGTRGTATITPLSAARVATPTGQAGPVPPPAAPTAARPGEAAPVIGGAASATPNGQPAPTPTSGPNQAPTATPSPAVFASKATAQPVLRSTATRPNTTEASADSTARNDGWVLALGGGAVILAAFLGGIALLLWRQRRS